MPPASGQPEAGNAARIKAVIFMSAKRRPTVIVMSPHAGIRQKRQRDANKPVPQRMIGVTPGTMVWGARVFLANVEVTAP